MQTSAFAVAPVLALFTFPSARPAAVAHHLKAVLPHVPEVIAVDVTLYVISAEGRTGRNGTVREHGGDIHSGAAEERRLAGDAFVSAEESFAGIVRADHPLCARLADKVKNLSVLRYGKVKKRIPRGASLGQHNPMLHTIVEDLVSKNLSVRDDGAIVVYLEQFKDKDGKPRGVIVQKKDGGYLYTTTDIACTKYRCEHFHANRIICFADSRQHEHLLMAWNIASLAGYVPNGVSLEHGAFGMMLGKDGKPFKTRTGGTVKLKDLLDEAEVRAATLIQDKNSDLTQ